MKTLLFFIILQISRAIMDNLEDLRIIDSLLKNYDRRATPTNRMGKGKFYNWGGVGLSMQIPQLKITIVYFNTRPLFEAIK